VLELTALTGLGGQGSLVVALLLAGLPVLADGALLTAPFFVRDSGL